MCCISGVDVLCVFHCPVGSAAVIWSVLCSTQRPNVDGKWGRDDIGPYMILDGSSQVLAEFANIWQMCLALGLVYAC